MASVLEQELELTLTDLADRFGPMPVSRIRRDPHPGTATIEDLLAIHGGEGKLCELVDGVLVEKPMGYKESALAHEIGYLLETYIRGKKLGLLASEAGMFRLAPELVRIPDVSFISRDRLPGGKAPDDPIPGLTPNLAVEVLSRGNTDREMSRKLEDYFQAGVELVWFFDPPTRTVKVFTAPESFSLLTGNQLLTGGAVLPGFEVKVALIFAKLDEI